MASPFAEDFAPSIGKYGKAARIFSYMLSFQSQGNNLIRDNSFVGNDMDERMNDNHGRQLIRLQKGWMPVEWSNLFPEPNTPVLSFSKSISDKEKLLRMSFLVHEFLI
jgi:hypothetical protein